MGTQAPTLRRMPIVTPPLEVDTTVVVDMTSTEFCDSSGLSALAAALCRAQAAGGELRLVVGSPVVRKVLAVTGMDSVCVVFDQLPEAIAARVARPGSPAGLSG
jgi:anti-sigma B factor antagonist